LLQVRGQLTHKEARIVANIIAPHNAAKNRKGNNFMTRNFLISLFSLLCMLSNAVADGTKDNSQFAQGPGTDS